MSGQSYVSGRAEAKKAESVPSAINAPYPHKPSLTKREIEITRLVVQGFTNHKIAEKLSISLQTVQTHRKNVIRKTGSKNIMGLINYAIQNGLIEDIMLSRPYR